LTFGDDPSSDAVFVACLPGLGDVDWSIAGPLGIGNDDVAGPPEPVFRYGRDDDGPFLSIHLGDGAYRRRGDVRIVWLDRTLPESVLAAMRGRPIDDVIDVPGLGGWLVEEAMPARMGGVDIRLVEKEDEPCPSADA
jgi:hypothetical protein